MRLSSKSLEIYGKYVDSYFLRIPGVQNASRSKIRILYTVLIFAIFVQPSLSDMPWGEKSYRINCGGPGFVDSTNRTWSPDDGTTGSYAVGGFPILAPIPYLGALQETSSTVADADANIFETSRIFPRLLRNSSSTQGYTFPVDSNGRYFLRLYFLAVSPSLGTDLSISVGGINISPGKLSLSVNGYQLLSNFYPLGGNDFSNRENIPDYGVMREFILPELSKSQITIQITPIQQYALLSGLELFNTKEIYTSSFPPSPSSPLPLLSGAYTESMSSDMGLALMHRINCGGSRVSPSYDYLGRSWQSDYGFDVNSFPFRSTLGVNLSNFSSEYAPAKVYESVRMSEYAQWVKGNAEIMYNLSVVAGEKYFLRLHFIDYEFNTTSVSTSSSSSYDEANYETQNMIFDALLNYNPVLRSVDVNSQASGKMKPLFKDFIVTAMYSQTILQIFPSLFSSSNYGVTISAIEIFKLLPSMSVQSSDSVKSVSYPSPSPPSSSSPSPSSAHTFTNLSQGSILISFLNSMANSSTLSSWVGEPCTDLSFWFGVGCLGNKVNSLILSDLGLNGTLNPVIGQLKTLTNLWLDGNSISGNLPSDLGKLVQLQSLRLHNNSFSGLVPESFGQMINLFELTMNNNQLTGEIPKEVLSIPSLSNTNNYLSYSRFTPGNTYLCASPDSIQTYGLPFCYSYPANETEKKKKSKAVMIGVVVGSVTAFLLLFFVILFACFFAMYRKRDEVAEENDIMDVEKNDEFRKTSDENDMVVFKGLSSMHLNVLSSSSGRIFNLSEMKKSTKNFSDKLILGSGGFGKVYHGQLSDGVSVAVKRHVKGSGQGSQQFFVELDILSKVRHRHLVSLIGYCLEKNEMILVYEFMPHGTLRDHLCSKSDSLTWQTRLKIAIGAAKGIDYLHHGLSPPIIHRDVKSTNILLDGAFFAKVGDFGLSRIGPLKDETHVSTAVRGSFGYVDPEYYKWLKLTEKSDVYSFGVVLLELIAGRKVIDLTLPYENNQVNLVEWARPFLESKMIIKIVDKNMNGDYCHASLEKIADLVLECLQEPGNLRPSMTEIVRRLEESLKLENVSLTSSP